jgi:hypothetical protein
MKRFVGKLEDLRDIKSTSHDGKVRYFCPYCDSVHGRSPDKEGCLVFNQNTLSGYCFRCETLVTHDGLKSLDYIKSQIEKHSEKERGENLLKIDWLIPIENNPEALEYIQSRYITSGTLRRFNVMSFDDPLAVVYINKILPEDCTDFLQGRFIKDKDFKHAFIKNTVKPLCWLHLAESPNLILCEGFTDGLSAYQHGKYNGDTLHPVVLGGKTITEDQIQELREYCSNYSKVVINVCMDGGFFEDTLKIASKVYQTCYNAELNVIHMPYGKDLNEISSSTFKGLYEKKYSFEPCKLQYIRNEVYGK